MSQPLTAERFDQFEHHFDETMSAIASTLNQHGELLADHTKRLERIEQLLWHGERLTELEARVRKLAEEVGHPELATPFTRPVGT